MARLMIAVLTGLFVMGLSIVSFAGMMDTLTGQAEEAKQEAHETMEKKGAESGKAIEAKDATEQDAGGMMDKAKETAKDQAKEKIDTLGK